MFFRTSPRSNRPSKSTKSYTRRVPLQIEFLEDRTLLDGSGLHIEFLKVPATANEGVGVSLSADATDSAGGSLNYAWVFGDGTSESGADLSAVTHVFAAPPTSNP